VRPFCPFLHPLRVTLVGLAWEGSPVASQHSYGGKLSSGATCVQSGNEQSREVLDASRWYEDRVGFPDLPCEKRPDLAALDRDIVVSTYHR
jgi:hypothetical protein